MPLAASVKISSAPNAFRSTLLSKLIDAGIVNMSLYPLEAAINARPMPVFPLVGSTKILYKGKEYNYRTSSTAHNKLQFNCVGMRKA